MGQKWTKKEFDVIQEFVKDPEVDVMTDEMAKLIYDGMPDVNQEPSKEKKKSLN